MKPFSSLTTSELLALSTTDLDAYVTLETAKAGILPIQEPTPPTLRTIPAPKHPFYKVENYVFETTKDAETFLTLCAGQLYWRSDYKTIEPETILRIEKVFLYTPSEYESLKDDIRHNETLSSAYGKAKDAYRDFLKAQQSCYSLIHNTYQEALANHQRVHDALASYQSFLALTTDEDNKALPHIAAKLLLRAYTTNTSVAEAALTLEGFSTQAIQSFIDDLSDLQGY